MQMDAGLAAIPGATAGALIGFSSGPVLNFIRHKQERNNLASGFAGEISAILKMGSHVQPAITFEKYLPELRSGPDCALPFIIRDVKFEVVYLANVSKLVLLPGDSARSAHRYHFFREIRYRVAGPPVNHGFVRLNELHDVCVTAEVGP